MDTGDDTRHRNRNQNRVMETRVVDTRNGAVLVVCNLDCNRVVDTQDGAAIGLRIRAVDTVDSTVSVILIHLASASSLLVGDWDASAPVVLWATSENQR